jgi:ADP-ribosylglycohydrolase
VSLAEPVAVAAELGNGSRVLASDTVPFAIWCAATHLGDFKDALWSTASVGGDVDTTCAMVGGIVAGAVGTTGIPDEWRASREPLM